MLDFIQLNDYMYYFFFLFSATLLCFVYAGYKRKILDKKMTYFVGFLMATVFVVSGYSIIGMLLR